SGDGHQAGESARPRIGFPATLGLADPTTVVDDLASALDAEVFEIASLPPSVPGLRLQNLLRAEITRLGGRILDSSEVVTLDRTSDGAIELVSEAAARRQV